jgi:hypothetical protein
MLAQGLMPHEQPQVPARGGAAHDRLGRRARHVGEREDLIGRGDVVVGAGRQVQRAGDTGGRQGRRRSVPTASKEARMSSTTTRIAAAALAALALTAPAAYARPINDPPTTSATERDLSAFDATPDAPVTVQATDDGFDWGSAGVGAGAVGGVILVAVGSFSAAHRVRMRIAR